MGGRQDLLTTPGPGVDEAQAEGLVKECWYGATEKYRK